GDRIRYDGAVWTVIPTYNGLSRGWLDATAAIGGTDVPFRPIDGTTSYERNEYLICLVAGEFDFTTGEPVVVAGTGTEVEVGDRIRYDGVVWSVIPQDNSLMKGWFNPTIIAGGTEVDHPVVDASTLYNNREYVISRWQGTYDFAVGDTSPTGVPVEVGDVFMFDGAGWIPSNENKGLMRGWFNPTIAAGYGSIPWDITDASTDYEIGEYIIAEIQGQYDFVAGAPVIAPAGTSVNNGDVWRFTATGWELVNSDKEGLSKGWLDATAAAGGVNVPFQPIDGTIEYEEDEYLICLVEGEFDFTTGEPVVVAGTGTLLDVGDRIRFNGANWNKIPQNTSLMKGWFDPNAAGGGADVDYPVIAATTLYNDREFVVARFQGTYDLTAGVPDPTGTPVEVGDVIIYGAGVWARTNENKGLMRGWFDPSVAAGYGTVPWDIVDNSTDYRIDEYIIADTDGHYDFAAGVPDPLGNPVAKGQRWRFTGTLWESETVDISLMRGWFNPTIDGGGTLVRDPVVENSVLYANKQYVISRWQGHYDFALGVVDPAGTPVEVGDVFMFTGTTWDKTNENKGLMRGWFDPIQTNGYGTVPWDIIDTSTDYEINEYIVAYTEGTYNFATGLPDAIAGESIKKGDIWRFTVTGWVHVNDSATGLSRGWLDATAASGGVNVPAQPIDGSINYDEDEYLICLVAGEFDFTTGEPVVVAGTGIVLEIGDRIRYDGTVWAKIESPSGLMRGWLDPNSVDGGLEVDHPVVDGSLLYSDRDYVIARGAGHYNYATGLPDVINGVAVEEGDIMRFDGTNWINERGNGGLMRGWFNPTINDGGLIGEIPWAIIDGSTDYDNNEYVIAEFDGTYDFATALVDPIGGQVVKRGEVWRYFGGVWVRESDNDSISRGWIDATAVAGGTNLPAQPIDGSIHYNNNDYIICLVNGEFDFTTGEPTVVAGTGVDLDIGDRVRYDG
ncbi:MAG: hypothetical protein DRQ42_09075, partial [Gammaproteobacteria bacterium]